MSGKHMYQSFILLLVLITSMNLTFLFTDAQTNLQQVDFSNEKLPVLTNSSFYILSRDFMADSAISPDNSVYAVGSLLDRNFWNQQMIIAKWDEFGNLVWGRTWNITRISMGYGICLGDNSIYVVGMTYSDILVGKWSLDGRLLWNTTVDTGMNEMGLRVAVDEDSNMYICGYREGLVGQMWVQQRFLMRLNPTGVIDWLKAFDSSYITYSMTDVLVHPDGYLITLRMPLSISRWHFDGTYYSYDTILNTTLALGMALDKEGNIYTSTRDSEIPVACKWSSEGSLQWSTPISGTVTGLHENETVIESLSVSEDGTVFVLAKNEYRYETFSRSLIRLSSHGEPFWSRRVLDSYWPLSSDINIHCGSNGLLYACGTISNGMYVEISDRGGQKATNRDLALAVFNPDNSTIYTAHQLTPALITSGLGTAALLIGYALKRKQARPQNAN